MKNTVIWSPVIQATLPGMLFSVDGRLHVQRHTHFRNLLYLRRIIRVMKKTYLILTVLLISQVCQAQLMLTKRHRFGLSASLGAVLNTSNSTVLKLDERWSKAYSYGFNYEYQYDTRLAFRSGFYFSKSYAMFASDPSADEQVYYFGRFDIFQRVALSNQQVRQGNGMYGADPNLYRVFRRKYMFSSFTIPLEVVLHSKMKAFLRYYVKGGLHNQLNYRTRAFEESKLEMGLGDSNPSYSDYQKIKTKDTPFLGTSLMLGGGAEYCFSGTSSFFIDLEICLPATNNFRHGQDRATLLTGPPFTAQPEKEEVLQNYSYIHNSLWQFRAQLRVGLFF